MDEKEPAFVKQSEKLNNPDLIKLRFEYAWRWFDFHAKQRVTMFNFFLIITGIFASAFVSVFKECQYLISTCVSFLGFITSVGFFCLDWRNKELVDMSEDILLKIEKDDLFTADFKVKRKDKIKEEILHQGGFMLREYEEDPRWKQGERWRCFWKNFRKHKYVIRSIEVIVGAFFLTGFVYSLVKLIG